MKDRRKRLFKEKNKLRDKHSGCSAVRLAYLVWDQVVAGSNPATPTKSLLEFFQEGFFVLCAQKSNKSQVYNFTLKSIMELIIATIAALIPIINPFSTAPMFLAMTKGDDDTYRNTQAKRGVIYMVIILLVFLVAGTFIMNFFGLSLPGMRIAGGILISGVGMRMLNPPANKERSDAEEKEASQKQDISLTPLAMPSLSGPGAISVIIGMSSLADSIADYFFIAAGVLVVAVIVFATLRSASKMVKYLGVNGLNAMTKIMGFIILCVGVQFIVNGVIAIATSEVILQFLQKIK